MAKINITIDDSLLKEVDEFSKAHFISRSGLIALGVHWYILNQKLFSSNYEKIINCLADQGRKDSYES